MQWKIFLLSLSFFYSLFSKQTFFAPGENFDYDFLCIGFDRILAMEHHAVSARLLTLIYNNASVFEGEGRMKVFGNLLIQKYGPQLFLSWDVNTRVCSFCFQCHGSKILLFFVLQNIFQQFLVFKLLRHTRKQLQSAPPNPSNKVFDQDRILLTKQEALIRTIKRQCKEKDASLKCDFDPHLESYYERAIADFEGYMEKYKNDPESDFKLQVIVKGGNIKA